MICFYNSQRFKTFFFSSVNVGCQAQELFTKRFREFNYYGNTYLQYYA